MTLIQFASIFFLDFKFFFIKFIILSSSILSDSQSPSSFYFYLHLSADLWLICSDSRRAISGLLLFPAIFNLFKLAGIYFLGCCSLFAFFFYSPPFAYILVLRSIICFSSNPDTIFIPRYLCCYFINYFCYFFFYFYTKSFHTTLLVFFYLFVGSLY